MTEAAAPSTTIVSWNFTNWITVVLMALIFFGIVAAAQKWFQSRQGGEAAA